MRKVVLSIALLVLLSTSFAFAERIDVADGGFDANVILEESSQSRTVVRYEVGGFERQPVDINGDTFYRIANEEATRFLTEGEPEVLHISRSIIIPDDAHMTIRVIDADYVDIPNTPIAPSKGNLLRTVDPETVPYTFGKVYFGKDFYPSELASIREPHIMRDYRATVIDLNAFQYNPATQTLRVYTSVTVEVVADGPGQVNVLDRIDRPGVFEFQQLYERNFLNYAEVASTKYDEINEFGNMLIICYDDFIDEMADFIAWKNQKGILTTVVPISAIGNSSTAIKDTIQGFYDNPANNLAWVLLVGDYSEVTSPYASGGASDPSYALLAGSDYYPEIVVGRFSAQSSGDVLTQVERTITYERDITTGDWLHKGTGIASTEGPGHFGEYDNVHMGYIRDDLLAYTYTEVDEFYGYSASASDVTNALNIGRSVINYVGHGSTTAWSTTGFNNTNVNNLANNGMLPFIWSVACVNGEFDGPTCFAEAWMRATNNGEPTGSIANYMSSINQSWSPPMDAQDEFNDLMVAETKGTFGALSYSGSCKMMDLNSGSSGYNMYNTWHIFGDPSVLVRTNTPSTLTVNHDGAVFFNTSQYDVEVVGVEGALCALYYDGVLYGSAYTDASGNASIPVSEALPIGQEVLLTVTNYNSVTVVETVTATSDLTILHQGLPDTKDTLNGYDVYCDIFTDAPLYTDSLFLYWDAGSGYTQELLTATGLENEYMATIPAQSAGTQVNYYLWATNEANYVDSIGVFTFEVIDYAMLFGPDASEQTAAVDDTAWFLLTVTNDGVLADEYTLSVGGNSWSTELYDEFQASPVTSSGTLNSDESFDFYARVIVPSSLEGEFDLATVTATSVAVPAQSESAIVKTISAGEPWPIPFTEQFMTTSLDMYKWELASGVEVNGDGLDETSPPYSLNLDGADNGADTLISEMINLKNESSVIVKYQWQRTGGGDSPEAGDDLYVEFLDSLGSWNQAAWHDGSGDDMTQFEENVVNLPASAMHAGFRIRFRSSGTAGPYDDWFVDDLYIGHPPNYDLAVTPWFQSAFGASGDTASYSIFIRNKGLLDDTYDLVASGNSYDVSFWDETGMTQITTTSTVTPNDSIQVVVKVAVPDTAPLHETDTASITATSVGDINMSGSVMVSTTAEGVPANYPWFEDFPTADLYDPRWMVNIGAVVSSSAMQEPSPDYSLLLDGAGDTICTQMIDLENRADVILTYYVERGGSMSAPSTGDQLMLEYLNNLGQWLSLYTHVGNGQSTQYFEEFTMGLPADAYHSAFQLRLISTGSGSGYDNWFVDDISIDYAPAITVTPGTGAQFTMGPDEIMLDAMIINNDGPGSLNYNINVLPVLRGSTFGDLLASGQVEPAVRSYPEGFENYEDIKGSDDPRDGFPVTRNAGGPDIFGYYWLDSDEAGGPAYNWVDISATGTDIVGQLDDDNYAGPFPIGFGFPYYDSTYTHIYVGSNGILGFASDNMSSRIKQSIPTSTTPNAILAWLWDDLDPTDADNPNAHVYYETVGDKFIISFVDYSEYSGVEGDVVTAQVILEADGTITYQYQTIAAGFDIANCAIGIEDPEGTDGLEVCYLTPYLHDNLAIQFSAPHRWLTLDYLSGSLAAGEADTIECAINTEGMEEGDYMTNVIVRSNDPDPEENPWTIGFELTVQTDPQFVCGDFDGDGNVNIADLTAFVGYLFNEGPAPQELDAIDVNADGSINVADLTYFVGFLFNEGPDLICP